MDTGNIMANRMDDLISARVAQKYQQELLESDNVFLIKPSEDTIASFFEKIFIGGKVKDEQILTLGKDEYGIVRLHPIGVDMEGVRLYRLEFLQPPPDNEITPTK